MPSIRATAQFSIFFWLVAATLAPAQVFNTLVSFDNTNGQNPQFEGLVQGRDGNLYGTTYSGGSGDCSGYQSPGCGVIFQISPDGQMTTLHSFNTTDGSYPYAGVILGLDGNFYGTTSQGGTAGDGTVFRISPQGAFTTLHSFSVSDGAEPWGALVQGDDGAFYGTTEAGGAGDEGTVFKITRNGQLTTLYSFCSQPKCTDGAQPRGALIQASDGNFYGTTCSGGSKEYDAGTIFRITPAGRLTTLYRFSGTDGDTPQAGLVEANDGNLYGTTPNGGAHENGTVFRLAADGTFTSLYSFGSSGSFGPQASLIQATDGNLWGTTNDSTEGSGTIFSITFQGVYSLQFGWPEFPYPVNDNGSMLQATNGTFYGATFNGGNYNVCGDGCGTVFSLSERYRPFVSFVGNVGKVGLVGGVLGQGFTGTTAVTLNGTAANFKVFSDSYLTVTVPPGATSGYVTVTTPRGELKSSVPFYVIP